MKFTSSARKSLALFLSLIFLAGAQGAPPSRAELPAEPCVLLKVSAATIPQEDAKRKLGSIQNLLEKGLRVRWVSPKPSDDAGTATEAAIPVADGKALETIAAKLGEAIRLTDRMETKKAAERLAEAETLARSFRFGETTRPFLAEVFLRRGLLALWEGNTGKAEEMLARSRVLRPEFEPDPAIFSPLFLAAWKRSGERPPPQAELFVSSLPSGARIFLDGKEAERRRVESTSTHRVPSGCRCSPKGTSGAEGRDSGFRAIPRHWNFPSSATGTPPSRNYCHPPPTEKERGPCFPG